MNEELTDKKRISILKTVNRHTVEEMLEIKERCQRTIDWAEKEGYDRPKCASDVLHIVEDCFLWLEMRQAELREIEQGVDKNQVTLTERWK